MIKKLSLSVMTFTYLFAGVAHFIKRDYFAALTPPFIPSPGVFVLLTGTVYILLALFLLFEKTRRGACYAILLLLAVALPVNLYLVFSESARGTIPLAIVVGRIPFKLFLMLWAYWMSVVYGPKNKVAKSLI